MKALFLIFHGFEEGNGISKKIRYQIKALKEEFMKIYGTESAADTIKEQEKTEKSI